ncbi:MAG: RHS repeat-associated core domain-containing protein, partial [Bacteroidales bacterium]|nr:RHS repeat-associated core domain-containing protein [Bacteroidales bacterium]
RELTSLQVPSNTDFVNNIPVPNTGTNAMQTYTQQYAYDEIGNITQMKSVGDWTRDYIYDTSTNQLLRHTGSTNVYTYDAHGNMLTMPHLTSMVWDFKDQLVSAGNGTVTSYYNYDAEGNRTRKVVEKPGGIREERYYVGGYEVFRKYISNSLDTERETVHIMDDRDRFAMMDTLTVENGTTLTTPVETIRYQYSNHLGSACLELNGSADIISYEEYHPFGTTSYRSGRNEVDVSLKRYRYVGKERDEETGLYYYGARYYAAWIARWISPDPMKEERIWVTPYNYCQNNPVVRVDPTGALDDEWDVNIKTGAVTHVNTKGGIKEQTINIKDENGKILNSETYDATGFDVALTEDGVNIFASNFLDHQYSGSNSNVIVAYAPDGMFLSTGSNSRFGVAQIESAPSINDGLNDINQIINASSYFIPDSKNLVKDGMWLAKNGKWTPIANQPNRWTGSKTKVLNNANKLKVLNRAFFYTGGLISLTQFGVNVYNEDYLSAGKNVLDIAMSAAGTFGGTPGLIISLTYFSLDALGTFNPPPAQMYRPIDTHVRQDVTNVCLPRPIEFKNNEIQYIKNKN